MASATTHPTEAHSPPAHAAASPMQSSAWAWAGPGLGLLEGAGTKLGATALLAYVALATGAYALFEQLRFRINRQRKGGKLVPGPAHVVPFLGGLIEMVMDPYAFWERQKDTAGGWVVGPSGWLGRRAGPAWVGGWVGPTWRGG